MIEFAPPTPKTKELKARYPQSEEERARVLEMRKRTSHMLGSRTADLLVTIGPCGPTEDAVLKGFIERESQELERLNTAESGILWLHRLAEWKPRTNKKDWHGLSTTSPELAYRLLRDTSGRAANIAMEINTDNRHLKRNSDLLTLAWKGGRNGAEATLTETLALHDPSLPIAIKNGLDGEIDMALGDVDRIMQLRKGMGADAVLLYRGGDNAMSPEAWEKQYLEAHARTGGLLIVDTAHGSEQAHHPEGNFKKSVEGQIHALDHIIAIGKRPDGVTPAGLFIEASDHAGRTDPNMPFALAIEKAEQIAEIRRNRF